MKPVKIESTPHTAECVEISMISFLYALFFRFPVGIGFVKKCDFASLEVLTTFFFKSKVSAPRELLVT